MSTIARKFFIVGEVQGVDLIIIEGARLTPLNNRVCEGDFLGSGRAVQRGPARAGHPVRHRNRAAAEPADPRGVSGRNAGGGLASRCLLPLTGGETAHGKDRPAF